MLRKPTLVSVLALGILFTSSSVSALGLGGMRTQSALNQPFFAEIDLFDVNSDELDAVKVRLAGRDEFDKAGAERPHFLTRLSFVPMIGPGGRPIVQVTSREPIREPYLDFLVEVLWPGGRLVKEYTVLMDLPGSGVGPAPRVVQPQTSAPVRRPPPQPRVRVPEPPPPPPRQTPARAADPAPAAQPEAVASAQQPDQAQAEDSGPTQPAAPGTSDTASNSVSEGVPRQAAATAMPIRYTVPNGLGLWRIARRVAPPGATVEQTAMALYRNNQDAFMRGDINRLMVGVELSIPSAEELFALDAAAAKREFQDALAGRSFTTEPIADTHVRAELRIAAPVEEAQDAPASAAVTDESAAPASAVREGAPDLEEDLLLVREASESNRQETTELRNRVLELEGQLEDIRRLLELRNEQLAQLQQAARAGERTAASLALAEPGVSTAGEALPAPVGETVLDGSEPMDDATELLPAARDDADLVQQEAAPAAAASAAGRMAALEPAVEAAAVEADPAVAEDQSETALQQGTTPADTAQADTGPIPTAAADVGMLGSMLSTLRAVPPWALAAGGGGLLIGSLGLLALRRRRQMTAAGDALAAPGSEGSVAGGSRQAASPGYSASSADLGAARKHGAEFGDDLALDLDLISDSELGDVDQSVFAAAASGEPSREIDVQTGLPSSTAASVSYRQPETQETDIIAEADIYLLYGRFREAEAILQEEIQNDPDRSELKYKLAEAYIGSGNSEALIALAEQMRAAGDDAADPARWAQISESVEALSVPADAQRPQTAGARAADAAAPGGPDLDIGAALGAAGRGTSELLDDVDDSELAFSVQEMHPSDADEVRQKLADLELDLQGLDGLDDLDGNKDKDSDRDGDRDADGGFDELDGLSADSRRSLESEIGMLDAGAQTWSATAPRSEPRPGLDPDASARWPSSSDGDDLDLDLDALKTFGHGDELIPPTEPGMPAADASGADAPGQAAGRDDDGDGGATPELGAADDWAISQRPAEPPDWDESATKMDLARAYLEMGDSAAARTILEEVVQEGDAARQAEAKTLIESLG